MSLFTAIKWAAKKCPICPKHEMLQYLTIILSIIKHKIGLNLSWLWYM